MTDEASAPSGPDLTKGVARPDFVDGRLVGHAGDDDVLVVEAGSEIFAVGAHCSHYHGPLADGLLVGTSVRCPWHHACFDLRNGEALRAPALSPVDCWKVEQRDGKIFVKEKLPQPKVKSAPPKDGVNRIVI
ncbi:MAG: Rieske 2Fe-2S domain-containing protein, partial [Xanthobacteraceae bacterium]